MQMIICHSRKSFAWTKNSEINGLMPWTRNFKTCSNPELLNVPVGIKHSNKARKIVPMTWAFQKTRHPSGEVCHFKACMCIHRDLQHGSYTNTETFASVVEWATIRMLFLLSIIEGWSTASIDFKNAFAQATLPKPIYLELLPGYVQANPGAKDKVMKIKKSLCGDFHTKNMWCRMLHKSLIEDVGFTCSEMDPCPFIKNFCIVVPYTDNAIVFSKDNTKIEHVLQQFNDLRYDFLHDKAFSLHLGSQLQHLSNGCIKLSQLHLKFSAINIMGLSDITHVQSQLHLRCSSMQILSHLTKVLIIDQLWAFCSTLGTTLILHVLMQTTHALIVA